MCSAAGKYYKGGPKPSGPRQAIFSDDKLEQVAPLIGLMKDIGSAHGGKTPTQVAINWVICKGAIPIVGESSHCSTPLCTAFVLQKLHFQVVCGVGRSQVSSILSITFRLMRHYSAADDVARLSTARPVVHCKPGNLPSVTLVWCCFNRGV